MSKEKTIIRIDDSVLKNNISDYKELHTKLDELKKESDSVSKNIKLITGDKWLDLYKETGSNPGTVVFEAEDFDGSLASITYIPSNRYVSITDKNKDSILSVVGEEFIDREIEHVIDSSIYNKYKDLINDFILNSDQVDPEDKLNFIKKVENISIKKTALDNIGNSENMEKIFETIKPVFSIKDPIVS